MRPFYFGPSEKSLFGIYHPPQRARHPGCGVVLCYPLGHEYIHGYRAFRQLAGQLVRAGFAVLRFDYYGCGDSAGDAEEGSLSQWMDDIGTAVEEMKGSGEVSKIYLAGARMGATLSALVASRRSDLEGLVLWDPVVNGKDYIKEIMEQHKDWLDGSWLGRGLPKTNNRNLEALGFPLSHALLDGLKQVELSSIQRYPVRRVLIVESDETSPALQLSDHLRGNGGNLEYQHIPAPRVWLRKPGRDNALVPMDVLQSIVAWISGITT